jgi:lipopolysaccharide assembly outer membrane protein LptD (OstA)
MKIALVVAMVWGAPSVVSPSFATAQSGQREMRARLEAQVQSLLESRQPVHLSADAVTLTGNALRLTGHARFRFGDTLIVADEAVVDQVTKRVELVGNVRAFGPAPRGAVPPRIQYR